MKSVLLVSSQIANMLLQEFYIPFGLASDSLYKTYEEVANKYLVSMSEYTIATMEETDFTENDFSFSADSKIEDRYDVILGMNNLWITILNVRDGRIPLFQNFAGLERQICPPIEVFKYKGFSELNITQNVIGYS